MSDSNTDMSDDIMSDGEPSMEDILASIRKVIAEDSPVENETETGPKDFAADIAQKELETIHEDVVIESETTKTTSENETPTDDDNDILELVAFIDENTERAQNKDAQQEKREEVPDFVVEIDDNGDVLEDRQDLELLSEEDESVQDEEPAIAFDETIDLVVDESASEFIAAPIARSDELASSWKDAIQTESVETESPQDQIDELDQIARDVTDESSLDIPEYTPDENVEDPLAELDDTATSEPLQSEINNMGAESITDEILGSPESGVEEETFEEEILAENLVEESNVELERGGASVEEDMDLVKSLLSDLMGDTGTDQSDDIKAGDQPDMDVSEPEIAKDDVPSESILDELLDSALDDEEELGLPGQDELGLADISEPETETDETELSKIAKAASEAADISDTASDSDDEIVFDVTDIKSRLALAATAGGVSAAAAKVVTTETKTGESLVESMEETLESEVQQAVAEAMPQQDEKLEVHAEDLETEPQAENIQDPQDPTPHIEETNEMMKPVDINKLVDEETDREATEAFASLNQAVREKTRLEESGPPIGDLVQEALKPMLQEWLDKNLKGIVERAVTKEIKRISSGK